MTDHDKPMSMVERCARAMATQHWHDNCLWDGPFPSVEQYADDEWTLWETTARAAISAMREPTEGMIAAADKIIEADNLFQRGYGYGGGAQQLHRAMIDAALTESK